MQPETNIKDVIRAERRSFLGGSDAAAVLGLSPWKTPLQLYYEKTETWPDGPPQIDPAKERLFARGKRLEPIALDMLRDEYAEQYKLRLVRRSTVYNRNYYTDREYPFLRAEIDAEAMVEGERVNVEVKTVHPFAAFKYGEAETDEIPVEYGAQAMHGLMVTGRRRALVAVLIGADNLVPYWIERDEETIAAMREKEVKFWTENVRALVPPDPLNVEDLSLLLPRKQTLRIEASAEVEQLANRYIELGAAIYQLQRQRDDVKFELGTALLGGELMNTPEPRPKHMVCVAGKPLLQVSYMEKWLVDGERLEKEHPDIFAQCRKASRYFEYRKAAKGAKA